LRQGLAVVTLAALVGCGVAGATNGSRVVSATLPRTSGTSWMTFPLPGQPASLELPSTWTRSTQKGSVFVAESLGTRSGVFATVYGPYVSAAAYFATAGPGATSFYRSQDPKAVIHSHRARLGSGESLEFTIQTSSQRTGPVLIQFYDVFYAGVGYGIEYQCPLAETATCVPVFDRSSSTIRFTLASPPDRLTPRISSSRSTICLRGSRLRRASTNQPRAPLPEIQRSWLSCRNRVSYAPTRLTTTHHRSNRP
jgi:hypothetical protein